MASRIHVRLKEQSWLAKLAARKLKSPSVAMVLGDVIHLHGVSREEFLNQPGWLRHEACHVRQFRRYGFWRFLYLYAWESARNGYYRNKFEVEARRAENDASVLQDILIL